MCVKPARNSDTEIGCAVSAAMGTEFVATLELTLTAAQTYAIFVDASTESLNWYSISDWANVQAHHHHRHRRHQNASRTVSVMATSVLRANAVKAAQPTKSVPTASSVEMVAASKPSSRQICLPRQTRTIAPNMGITGNSTNNPTAVSGSCGGAGAEQVVVFNPPADGAYCLSTQGSQFSTALYVREAVVLARIR